MKLTKHSIERLNERAGLNKSAAERIAERALRDGVTMGDVAGQLKKFLDHLFFHSHSCANLRVYGEKVYLFTSGNTLITVINLPNNLRAAANKAMERKRAAV